MQQVTVRGAGGQTPAGDAQGAGGQTPADDAQDADSKAPQGGTGSWAAHRTETQHRKHSKGGRRKWNYQICTEASGHCADGALMPDRVWYFFGV